VVKADPEAPATGGVVTTKEVAVPGPVGVMAALMAEVTPEEAAVRV
jgi:hypothetical protein